MCGFWQSAWLWCIFVFLRYPVSLGKIQEEGWVAKKRVLKVATCQFPVGGDVGSNLAWMARQVGEAAGSGADVVHFPEAAATGYAGTEFATWEGFDWGALDEAHGEMCRLAGENGVWVVFGSAHRLCGGHMPHNSLYVVDAKGRLVERYDKRFCTDVDLKHYTPGDRFSVFEIEGVKCGCLICYDVRFPELYRDCKRLGVELVFHSFYNARAKGPSIHTIIMPATLQARAATNYVWVSATNASGRGQSWSSRLVRPDGRVAAKAERNRAETIVNEIDADAKLYDASGIYRDGAMKGVLHSGRLVKDARSRDVKSF